MVAIRAALNLQHGAMKDFYICSLSSRYEFTSVENYMFVSRIENFNLVCFLFFCHLGLLSTKDN